MPDLFQCCRTLIIFAVILNNARSQTKPGLTAGSEDFIFKELPSGMSSFKFRVKASEGAHICLSSGADQDTSPMYQIQLGESRNMKSLISREHVQPDGISKIIEQLAVRTPKILRNDEFRGFWLRWEKEGRVVLGREGEINALIDFNNKNPLTVTHFGYRNKIGTTADWDIQINEQPKTSKLRTVLSPDFQMLPYSGGLGIVIKVKSQHEVHFLLSTSEKDEDTPSVQIKLGTSKNNKVSIIVDRTPLGASISTQDVVEMRVASVLSSIDLRGFWLSWDGQIKLGKEGEKEPILQAASPEQFRVSYFGLRSMFGPAEWEINTGSSASEDRNIKPSSPSVDIKPIYSYDEVKSNILVVTTSEAPKSQNKSALCDNNKDSKPSEMSARVLLKTLESLQLEDDPPSCGALSQGAADQPVPPVSVLSSGAVDLANELLLDLESSGKLRDLGSLKFDIETFINTTKSNLLCKTSVDKKSRADQNKSKPAFQNKENGSKKSEDDDDDGSDD